MRCLLDSLSSIGGMQIVPVVLAYLGIVITLGFGLNMFLGRQELGSVGAFYGLLMCSSLIKGKWPTRSSYQYRKTKTIRSMIINWTKWPSIWIGSCVECWSFCSS